MDSAVLNVEFRQEQGKAVSRRLRKKGEIPGVVYVKGKPSVSIKTDNRQLNKLLHQQGENVIIELKLKADGKAQDKTVIIKEIQYDSLKGDILHIDFQQIKLTERIKVNVPLVTKGESPGVKEGGILEHILRELEVECLPTQIPREIIVNVSALKIGEAIHVRGLQLPNEIKVITEPEQIVVLVKMQAEEVTEVEKPEEAEVAEPEVIKQKKPEVAGGEGEKEK